MAVQDEIKLSVLVAFRDRELVRVERFLKSLDLQEYRSFELVFVDYGSNPALAKEVRNCVTRYPWAKYVFNETTGMPWNRGHALNSAARQAKGEYLLCTDIDLIYSQKALTRLIDAADPDVLVSASFYLLPKNFSKWDKLRTGEFADVPLSHPNTVGAIQLLSRQAFYATGGFDEFFRIWGVEDFDFRARLQRKGIGEKRVESVPAYHQWHPSAASPEMPIGWLEVMNFHSMTRVLNAQRDPDSWGRCLTTHDRPALVIPNYLHDTPRFRLPSEEPKFSDFAAWRKIDLIRKLLRELADAAPGEAIICEIDKSPATRWKAFLARRILRFRYRPLSGRRTFDHIKEGSAIFWYIIIFSGLVSDYYIENTPSVSRYIIVRCRNS